MKLEIELPDDAELWFHHSDLKRKPVTFDVEPKVYENEEDEDGFHAYIPEVNNIRPFYLVQNGEIERGGANYLLIRAVINAFRDAMIQYPTNPKDE